MLAKLKFRCMCQAQCLNCIQGYVSSVRGLHGQGSVCVYVSVFFYSFSSMSYPAIGGMSSPGYSVKVQFVKLAYDLQCSNRSSLKLPLPV